jgi:hypothetical protein
MNWPVHTPVRSVNDDRMPGGFLHEPVDTVAVGVCVAEGLAVLLGDDVVVKNLDGVAVAVRDGDVYLERVTVRVSDTVGVPLAELEGEEDADGEEDVDGESDSCASATATQSAATSARWLAVPMGCGQGSGCTKGGAHWARGEMGDGR